MSSVHACVVESVPAALRAITGNGVNVLAMGAFYVAPAMGCDTADAYIVWTYGLMRTEHDDFLRENVEVWATETGDTKTSYCSLVEAANTDGGAEHPLAPYHAQAAEILAQHIADVLGATA